LFIFFCITNIHHFQPINAIRFSNLLYDPNRNCAILQFMNIIGNLVLLVYIFRFYGEPCRSYFISKFDMPDCRNYIIWG